MADITVDTSLDVTNSSDGITSLREAIASSASGDRIVFDSSLSGSILVLTQGKITLTQDIIIDGDLDGDQKADIAISGDTNSDGMPDTGLFRLDNSAVTATFGSLTLTKAGNGSPFDGAIFGLSGSTVNLVNSTISDSRQGGAAVYATNLNIINSTLTGNAGGALRIQNGGTSQVVNSTIYGNQAEFDGAGIVAGGNVSLSLINTTVTNNTAGNVGGGLGIAANTTVNIFNSVVAENTAPNGTDIGATFFGTGQTIIAQNSFFGSDVSGVGTFTGKNVQINAGDPGLGPLFDHGGVGLSVAPEVSSPLLEAGDSSLVPADTFDIDGDGNTTEGLPIDLTGQPRISGTVDIGAVEGARVATPPTLIVSILTDESDGDFSFGDLSLREAVSQATQGTIIQFDPSLANGLFRLTLGEINVTTPLTIDGQSLNITITGDANGNDVLVSGTALTDVSATSASQRSDNSRIFNIDGALSHATLNGLTLTGGFGQYVTLPGNGGAVNSDADLTITNSSFIGNASDGIGGAVFADNITISNSSFSGNRAFDGGGGAIGTVSGNIAIADSSVSDNGTLGTSRFGGGIFGFSDVDLTNTTVSNNYTTGNNGHGGGIWAGDELTLANSTLRDNVAGGHAGGAYGRRGATVEESVIDGNQSGNRGAGLMTRLSPATVIDSEVTNNTALFNVSTGGAGGAGISSTGSVTIIRSDVSGNVLHAGASSVYGGGVYGRLGIEIVSSSITDNHLVGGRSGGGVSSRPNDTFGSGSIDIIDSIVAHNTTSHPAGEGGGVYGGSVTTIISSTISGNSTAGVAGDGGGVHAFGTLSLTNSIVSGNAAAHPSATGDELVVLGAQTYSGNNVVGENLFLGATLLTSGVRASDLFSTVTETLADADNDGVAEASTGIFTGPLVLSGPNGQTQDPRLGGVSENLADSTLLPADGFDIDQDGDLTEVLPLDVLANPRVFNAAPDSGGVEIQIPAIPGTLGNDSISGTSNADRIIGLLGDDMIFGLAGDDTLQAGIGDDTAEGGSGNDTLEGSLGNDRLFGGDHTDTILGESGNDTIDGGSGSDTLFGGIGDDTVLAANNADLVYGGDGNDSVDAGGGDDLVYGGAGSDSLTDGQGIDVIYGGDDDDVLRVHDGAGAQNADRAYGEAGNDTIWRGAGGANEDAYFGGIDVDTIRIANGAFTSDFIFDLGNDQLTNTGTFYETWQDFENFDGRPSGAGISHEAVIGTNGVNTILAGAGDNSVIGLAGSDSIDGGAGADMLFGGDDPDSIAAGAGNDTVDGGAGNDSLDGGADSDTLSFSSFIPTPSGPGVEVDLSDQRNAQETGAGIDVFDNFENIIGSSGGDSLIGDSSANAIWGEDGQDTIAADAGNDTVDGGGGNDSLDGGTDTDTLSFLSIIPMPNGQGVKVNLSGQGIAQDTGAGNDVFFNFENLTGSTGNDMLTGNTGHNRLDGDKGDDIVSGNFGNDSVLGGQGDDTVDGGEGNDNLDGGADTDTLSFMSFAPNPSNRGVRADLSYQGAAQNTGAGIDTFQNFENLLGSSGNDTLTGDSGDNILWGGAGVDSLDAGAGNDRVVYDALDALILGGLGVDTLVIEGGPFPSASFNLAANGFEGAELEVVDTTMQPWDVQRTIYDQNWVRRSDITEFDDGSQQDILYDPDDLQLWMTIQNNFDSNAQQILNRQNFDDGSLQDIFYDPDEVQAWDSNRNNFNASGQQIFNRQSYDDGSQQDIFFDPTDVQVWMTNRNNFNASGQQTFNRQSYDDGSRQDIFYDPTDAQAWTTNRNNFNASGQQTFNRQIYDDGSQQDISYDLTDLQVWSANRNNFDSAGQQIFNRQVYDDSTRQDLFYDPDDVQVWSTNRNNYNNSDALFFNRQTYDDGSRQDTTYDVDDQFAWEQRIQVFDALGNLVSEQFL